MPEYAMLSHPADRNFVESTFSPRSLSFAVENPILGCSRLRRRHGTWQARRRLGEKWVVTVCHCGSRCGLGGCTVPTNGSGRSPHVWPLPPFAGYQMPSLPRNAPIARHVCAQPSRTRRTRKAKSTSCCFTSEYHSDRPPRSCPRCAICLD
ncbi:hypothetical protein BJX66DRAFT_36170 [Aspergillus keveii]|uniref:Uncharacterized protein n=1 Tax=Aspergillus keveii TaxID=714993 RepID=A0ABR4GHV2_9EURO